MARRPCRHCDRSGLADEGVIQAIVEIARMIFRGDEVDRVASVRGVFRVRAVTITPHIKFPAVTPRAAVVVGDEIVRIKPVAAVK